MPIPDGREALAPGRPVLRLVDELHQLALIGDVRALTERLDALEREQRVTPDALDALRGLARNYDMKAIRAYLRPEHAASSVVRAR